jgi:hypothetical protein
MVSITKCSLFGRRCVFELAVLGVVSTIVSTALPVNTSAQCNPKTNHCLTVTVDASGTPHIYENGSALLKDEVDIKRGETIQWMVTKLPATTSPTDLFVLFQSSKPFDSSHSLTFHTVSGSSTDVATDTNRKSEVYEYHVLVWQENDPNVNFYNDPTIRVGQK